MTASGIRAGLSVTNNFYFALSVEVAYRLLLWHVRGQ